MRVALRRRQVLVPEQLRRRPNVGAAFEQLRHATVLS